MAPNARRPGWRTSTYSAPADLIDAAHTKAVENGTHVSAIIRDCLETYVQGNK